MLFATPLFADGVRRADPLPRDSGRRSGLEAGELGGLAVQRRGDQHGAVQGHQAQVRRDDGRDRAAYGADGHRADPQAEVTVVNTVMFDNGGAAENDFGSRHPWRKAHCRFASRHRLHRRRAAGNRHVREIIMV